MNALRLLVAGILFCGLTVSARADDKKEKADNAMLLVGKWEVTGIERALEVGGVDKKVLPVGAVIDFTKDGKMTIIVKKEKQINATYKVDGDKIHFTIIADGKEGTKDPITIRKLSETELIVVGKDGILDGIFEFERVK